MTTLSGVLRLLALVALTLPAQQTTPPVPTARCLVGGTTSYVVQPRDSLTAIGARLGVNVATLARQNALPANARLVSGTALRIDNRHLVAEGVDAATALVINIPQRLLFRRTPTGDVRAYPVAVGRTSWPTPLGAFTITAKTIDPTWHVPPSIQEEMRRAGRTPLTRVPPGPANPLGDRWLGTSLSNIGIHGTNAPASVYAAVTHGCIRLHPDDIHELFEDVDLKTRGELVYQTVLLASIDGRVFAEAHADVYRREREDPREFAMAIAVHGHFDRLVNWAAVRSVLEERDGIAHDVTAERTAW